MSPKRLGKRLKVGETFISITKRMSKDRQLSCRVHSTYEVLKKGEQRFLVKGSRKYFCEVLGTVQMTTGFWLGSISEPRHHLDKKIHGKRWWMFSYLVKILEN